jgi:hypothetical protein
MQGFVNNKSPKSAWICSRTVNPVLLRGEVRVLGSHNKRKVIQVGLRCGQSLKTLVVWGEVLPSSTKNVREAERASAKRWANTWVRPTSSTNILV